MSKLKKKVCKKCWGNHWDMLREEIWKYSFIFCRYGQDEKSDNAVIINLNFTDMARLGIGQNVEVIVLNNNKIPKICPYYLEHTIS